MEQALQVVGAIVILVACALVQQGRMATNNRGYLLLNLAGSALLAVLAGESRQWGFLLLEGAWALISLASLYVILRRRSRENRASHSLS